MIIRAGTFSTCTRLSFFLKDSWLVSSSDPGFQQVNKVHISTDYEDYQNKHEIRFYTLGKNRPSYTAPNLSEIPFEFSCITIHSSISQSAGVIFLMVLFKRNIYHCHFTVSSDSHRRAVITYSRSYDRCCSIQFFNSISVFIE